MRCFIRSLTLSTDSGCYRDNKANKVSDNHSYKIYTAGRILDNFNKPDVVASFSKVFSVPSEKAQAFVDGKKLIRKGLSKAQADSYRLQLEAIGVAIITVAADGTETVSEASPKPAAPVLTLAPTTAAAVATTAVPSTGLGVVEANAGASGFSCPKCQCLQEKSEECIECGIIFSRYEESLRTQQIDATNQPKARESYSDDLDDDSISLSTFILPLVLAIAGAFVWKILALILPGDLSLGAWVLGGAVGAAAVMAGGKGRAVGATCAVIAFAAIVAGKYMYISHHHELLMGQLGDGGAEALFEDMFQQMNNEFAAEFNTGNEPAVPIKITYNYEDSGSSGLIRDGSVTNMLVNSLGPLDWLFAFLGVVTAFVLGRSGSMPWNN